MVTDPVKEHDEYCLKREHLRNTSMQMQGEKNFRFTNFRTEKDRIVVTTREPHSKRTT